MTDRLAEQVTARIRHLLETCPACEERRACAASAPELSPREMEVLMLFSQDLSMTEVARRLIVATSTVASYAERIREKFAVGSMRAAVAAALRSGVIE